MAKSILHITNGDHLTNYLKKLKFSGEFITWREMLCEGKTSSDIGSEDFWKVRFDFLKDVYNITKNTFINFTLKEYRALCSKKNNDEIVLWFEHDLYCQINMIGVISWLNKHRKGHNISLVSSGKIDDSDKMYALTELSKTQLNSHFQNRITLTADDIEYADYIWQLYCSDSPLRLETVYKFESNTPFKYLAAAIEAHLTRFPSIENGLNSVENYILKTAAEDKFTSEKQLLESLLKNEQALGFTDLQYQERIQALQPLFNKTNYQLNTNGREVLAHNLNFYSNLRDENSFLGGARKYSFLHYNKTQKLLQITA